MKIAYVFVPHFPLAVEEREDASLRGQAVVIGGLPHERGKVYEVSPEALGQGVEVGMSLRQAEELCPEAIFLPMRVERYTSAFEEMLVALEPFSSYPRLGLEEAIKRGRQMKMAAGQTVEADVRAVAYEGIERVKQITEQGQVSGQ